jgi:S-adenosylmethionine-diacylgycerolhomoserine-N-methlytransferase
VLFSYALTMFNPGWERALSAARESLRPGGSLAVVDFHDTTVAAFQRWMALNHVKVEGQLLPRLRDSFPEREVAVGTAFLGTWSYFTFVGTNTRKPACGAGAVSQPSAPPRPLLARTM